MARSTDPAVRSALVEAAAELLATEGATALSLRRVASAVGTSTMAVYTHFGSKEDLVAAVVREGFARLHAELVAVPRTDDAVADLVAAAAAYRNNALANPDLYRVMFGLNPLALPNPAASMDTDGTGLVAFHDLVVAVARCIEAGALKGDASSHALVMWASSHGAVSLELAGLLGSDGATTFDATTTATFLGLASRP